MAGWSAGRRRAPPGAWKATALSAWRSRVPTTSARLAVAARHRRLEPERLELRLQVADRQLAAALAGAAPFQEVVGQEGEVGAQRRLADAGRRGGRRSGGWGCGGGGGEHRGGEERGGD